MALERFTCAVLSCFCFFKLNDEKQRKIILKKKREEEPRGENKKGFQSRLI